MTPAARSGTGAQFPARIVATFGRRSLAEDAQGRVWEATRRGKKTDVVIGDRVQVRESMGHVAIETIEPRGSLLFRSDHFRSKALAANIDLVVVVFASRPPPNRWFIWKALVATHAATVEALVVRNKCDLAEGGDDAAALLAQIAALGWMTLSVSAKSDPASTRDQMLRAMAGRSSLLIGQSGMGKSTLLNLLVPDANAKTQEYSRHLNLGRQTTTASRAFALPAGGTVIDTPGFQEFGLAHLGVSDIAATFPEFRPLLGRCRFLDCRHLSEPGCGIRESLATGQIAGDRYAFYQSLASGAVR
jgi:ribosome biogenesis GTPase